MKFSFEKKNNVIECVEFYLAATGIDPVHTGEVIKKEETKKLPN